MSLVIILLVAFWGFSNGYLWRDLENTGNPEREFREDVGYTLPGRLYYFPIWIYVTVKASRKEKVAE